MFLDEIGELPIALQSKLLRVIESGEFYRLGETKELRSEARIVAATNKHLPDEIKSIPVETVEISLEHREGLWVAARKVLAA